MICKKCGNDNEEFAKFCNNCGENLKKYKACPTCGEIIIPGDSYCMKCGTEIKGFFDYKKIKYINIVFSILVLIVLLLSIFLVVGIETEYNSNGSIFYELLLIDYDPFGLFEFILGLLFIVLIILSCRTKKLFNYILIGVSFLFIINNILLICTVSSLTVFGVILCVSMLLISIIQIGLSIFHTVKINNK